jgi:hypothetical protein
LNDVSHWRPFRRIRSRSAQVTPTRDSLDEFEFLEFDFLEL